MAGRSTIDIPPVPAQDSANNVDMRDVIGNKTDSAGGDSIMAHLVAVKADTNELQTDWTNGGRLDLLLDAIKAVTDALPNAGALTDLATAAANSSGDSSGTYIYLDAGGEQTVVELSTSTRKIVYGIHLDLFNITIDGATIKVYTKPDGSNYREVQAQRLTFNQSTDGDAIYVDLNMAITSDLKLTFEEGGEEGANRDIYYSLVYRTIE